MTIPVPTDTHDEAVFLTQVSSLANRFAQHLPRGTAEDLAQDVVLECLIARRAGRGCNDPSLLPGLIKRMVRRRSIDYLRRSKRRCSREQEYSRAIADSPRAWMSPQLGVEERELLEFHDRTLAGLSHVCRCTYVMVRDLDSSYRMVAEELGVSRATVNARVVAAQKHFRAELADEGIHLPAGALNKRKGRGTRSAVPDRPRRVPS